MTGRSILGSILSYQKVLPEIKRCFIACVNRCLLCHGLSPTSICACCHCEAWLVDDPRMQGNCLDHPDVLKHLCDAKFDALYCLDIYRFPLTYLVPLFKFQGREDLARYLGEQLYHHRLQQAMLFNDTPLDAIISVPLHWFRQRWRGYNQAQLIAEMVGALLDVEVLDELIIRHKRTRKQSELNEVARRDNVQNAFAFAGSTADAAEKLRSIRHIALVDDVITTGATLNALCRLIYQAAPHCRISVLCLGVAITEQQF